MKKFLALLLVPVLIIAGCSASWVDIAIKDLPVLVQIATSIISIVDAAKGHSIDPVMAQEIKDISTQVGTDLQLVQTLVNQYQSTKNPNLLAKIDSALADVQTNLSAILAAAHIKDTALQATITASISLAITVVVSIQSLVPAPPTPAVKAPRSPVKPMSAKDIKSTYNKILAANGYSAYAIK